MIPVFLLVSLLELSAEGPERPVSLTPAACVPFAEFRLAGATLASDSALIRKLHPALKLTRKYSGEDDGGAFTYYEESTPDVTFTFGRDRSVDGITVSARRFPLPSGVRVGMTLEEVSRRLRFSLSGIPPTAVIELSPCDSIEQASMALTFALDKPGSPYAKSLLSKIELWVTYD